MGDAAVEVALSIRAEHAKGPLWDAATARLWWVDINGQRVHCSDLASGNDSSWATAGQPGGVLLDAAGEPVVGSPEGLAVLDRSTGKMDLRVPVEQDRLENRANDVKTDSTGRAWVGTMAYDKRPGNAALYRVDDGKATHVTGGLTICNGPAFDEPRGRLYLADTALFVVDVFSLDPATGILADRRRFLDFGEAQVWPDGMTVDDEGMLWVALGRAGAVHCYRPDGTLDGRVELPVTNPTSVAFGGIDGAVLYITTARLYCEPDNRAAQPLGGAIFRCRPGVTGPPAPRYAGVPASPEYLDAQRPHRCCQHWQQPRLRTTDAVAIEKPFGTDLASAQRLNQILRIQLPPPVIFRIDYFLSGELVRRMLALRCVNRVFEPIWNAVHVDHVEISWLEGQASYDDRADALKDIAQNRFMEAMALVLMEQPAKRHRVPRPDLPDPQQDQTRPAGGRCETRVFPEGLPPGALAGWWRSRGVVRPAGVGGRLA